ncbi:MAG: hypothetical protein ACYDAD_13075 [Acidimicrobiales bacterium]
MSTTTDERHGGHAPHTFTFVVDDEPVTTEDRTLAPVEIMDLTGVDPATHYLVQVQGRHQISYQDTPSEEIEVHPNEVFVTVSTGPTPVS